jgi:hypothetical protein
VFENRALLERVYAPGGVRGSIDTGREKNA